MKWRFKTAMRVTHYCCLRLIAKYKKTHTIANKISTSMTQPFDCCGLVAFGFVVLLNLQDYKLNWTKTCDGVAFSQYSRVKC